MAKKAIKWTEGWLTRDTKKHGGVVAFFVDGAPVRRDGLWVSSMNRAGWCREAWRAADFDRIYGLKNAPAPGKKMLVDLQL